MRQSLPPSTQDVPLTVIGVVRSAHSEPENTPLSRSPCAESDKTPGKSAPSA
jgi:hypothetical protein